MVGQKGKEVFVLFLFEMQLFKVRTFEAADRRKT
jgi:hypothetical protein